MLVKKAGAKYKSKTARASATITNGDLGAWRRGLLNMEQQRINYVQVDYSVCDHDFLCRLKLFLFEEVVTEPLDNGHNLFNCSGPKDQQVIEDVSKLVGRAATQKQRIKTCKKLLQAFPDGPIKQWVRSQLDKLHIKSQHLGDDGVKRTMMSYVRAQAEELMRSVKVRISILGRNFTCTVAKPV